MNEEEKKSIEDMNRFANGIDMSCVIARQMQIILNLVEKLQKENEELKIKLSLKQFDINVVYNDYLEKLNEYKENSITVQKVKDKIEKEIKYHERNILEIENITMLKSKTAKEEAEIEFNKYAIVVLKKILQELIKEEEENHEENI